MSKEKKDKKENKSIPSNIIEAITSISPEYLIRSESSPSYPIETFNIIEKLDSSKKIKIKEKEYKIGNYLIKKTLGQGTFGKVKLGIYLPTGEKVAIKILEKDKIIEKDDEIRVKREFDMLAILNHPNVILVAEIFESYDNYYSVMEYCEGGELFNYIVKNRRLDQDEAAFFYFQLINGLEYIHSLGIVHRDLKPENLLLTKDHLLKIIDFGLSNYFREGQKEYLETPCGSPCYASPEMVSGQKYDGIKIDIWSTGIILYAMLCGYLPFEDKDNDILFEKILECKLIFPKYITKMAKDLMVKILVTDPDRRININEIKKHPFYLRGKSLFEQEFSICHINRDISEDRKSKEINEIKNILDNNKNNDNQKENNKNVLNFRNKEKKENNKKNQKNENITKNKNKEQTLTLNLEQKNDEKFFNNDYEKKMKILEIINSLNKDNNILNKQKNNSKKKEISKNNHSKNKVKNNININKKNLFVKNKELPFKIENKEDLKNKIINLRTKSRENRKIKKQTKIINYKKFKKHLVKKAHIDLSPNSKNNKQNNKNIIKRRVNYTNIIENKFNTKENSEKKRLVKGNVYLNNINNTIDNEKSPNNLKMNFNFQKNISNSIKDSKRTSSIGKNNMKLTSFEIPINKKEKKFLNFFNISSNIKKNEEKVKLGNIHNNNNNSIKKKSNLKEINNNSNNSNDENNFIKTEINIEKGKNQEKIKNNKMPNNNTKNANDINNKILNEIKIIINEKDQTNFKNNIKNTSTSVRKKNHQQKISPKNQKTIESNNNEKYIKRTFDKPKHIPILKHNSNAYNIIKENINYNLYENNNKKAIDTNNNKKIKINNNILANIDYITTHDSINNSERFTKKKISKKINNKTDIKEQNINSLYKQQIKNLNNINITNSNTDFNTIDNVNKTEHRKKIFKTNNKNLNLIINDDDKDKKQIIHIKLNSINANKTNNHKNQPKNILNQKKIEKKSKSNKSKNLNKTTNINSSLKNPFLNELNNFEIKNSSLNHNFNTINSQNINYLNKKYKNSQLISSSIKKKKPFITIRNTVINFNMIDTGIFMSSFDQKKEIKKRNNKIMKTSPMTHLNNNRLYGLCSKYNNNNNNPNNTSYSINNNLIIGNISNTNYKTINDNSNYDLYNKKIFGYKDNIKVKNYKKINKQDYQDKGHIKYNSMKNGEFYLKEKHKESKNFDINNININSFNENKLDNSHNNYFNTISIENFHSANEKILI